MTAPESPASMLRRAAALMRALAGGCEPRRWQWEALGEKRYPQRVTSEGNVALIAECFIDPAHRPVEAEYIASMHPLVGLALADWLDTFAGRGCDEDPAGPDRDAALAVARAYLNETEAAGERA